MKKRKNLSPFCRTMIHPACLEKMKKEQEKEKEEKVKEEE